MTPNLPTHHTTARERRQMAREYRMYVELLRQQYPEFDEKYADPLLDLIDEHIAPDSNTPKHRGYDPDAY